MPFAAAGSNPGRGDSGRGATLPVQANPGRRKCVRGRDVRPRRPGTGGPIVRGGLMEPIVLTGRWVRLEPLSEAHREGLRAAADDERIWEHFLMDGRGPGFDPWFDEVVRQRAVGRAVPFAVR